MKRFLLTVVALLVFAGQMFAAPVDVATAKKLGVSYLKNNVASAKSITDVEHVYTVSGDNGIPSLYVFNYENGYVIVAADDRAYPILAYSEESVFDVNHLPDGLVYYLGHYSDEIQYAIENDFVAEEEIAGQWELLRTEGITSRTRMDRIVNPLITTKWNQDYPYNYYAPAHNYGPGGRCYAGCVATAMSQVMRFWSWPDQGVGEHSYNTSTVGGTLSANFGETTYNWSNMPNTIPSGSPQAIALLMYHCGISVDMDYNYDGSGSQTYKVVDAAKTYFKYCSATEILSRESYTKTAWEDILIEQFDHGFPAVYAGTDEQMGHAFDCDGYDAQRKFHFNWGWSGWCDGFFAIDALNTMNGTFNLNQRVVVNMIPDYIYNALIPVVEDFDVEIENALTKTGIVTFTVPAVSMSGDPLTSIEKMELKRNGLVIKTFNNPTPGEALVYEDEVSDFGAYEYSLCGYNNNYSGETSKVSVIYGPNCTWKLVCTTSNFQGWNGGLLQVKNNEGVVIEEVTMTSSSPLSEKFQMPGGDFSLVWNQPATAVATMSISLKNSANTQVYNFSGSSTQINGTIYSGDNDCESCTSPENLAGEYAYQDGHDGARLTWTCDYEPQNFKIYRSVDGVEYEEIAKIENTLREYFDAVDDVNTYFYQVTAFNSFCESTPAITADDNDYVQVEVLAVEENEINARIYPNPTNGVIMIEAESINNVSVFNVVGQKVFEQNVNENQYVIDVKQFGNGVYMIRIETADGSMTQKVSVID